MANRVLPFLWIVSVEGETLCDEFVDASQCQFAVGWICYSHGNECNVAVRGLPPLQRSLPPPTSGLLLCLWWWVRVRQSVCWRVFLHFDHWHCHGHVRNVPENRWKNELTATALQSWYFHSLPEETNLILDGGRQTVLPGQSHLFFPAYCLWVQIQQFYKSSGSKKALERNPVASNTLLIQLIPTVCFEEVRVPCVVFKVCVRMSHSVLHEENYLQRAPEGPHPPKHHMLSLNIPQLYKGLLFMFVCILCGGNFYFEYFWHIFCCCCNKHVIIRHPNTAENLLSSLLFW